MERIHRRIVQKDLYEWDYYDAVVSHPEPDILECDVKRVLEKTTINKASGCNGIPVELFKTLNDDVIQVLHSICQQIWKAQQWPQDWKRSILIPIPKKGTRKEYANHGTVALISHASKVMLKIMHIRLQHYVTKKFQISKLGLEKKEGPEIKLSTFTES